MAKKTYKVEGMHCASCAMVIESDLEDAGIQATCSYAKQTLDLNTDLSPLDEGKVEQIVRNAGYTLVTPK